MLLGDMDVNSDGAVDAEEYLAYAESAIAEADEFTPLEKHEFVNLSGRVMVEADVDGDGALSENELGYAEFLKQVAYEVRRDAQGNVVKDEFGTKDLADQARRYDTDGDGVISKREFDMSMRITLDLMGMRGFLDGAVVVEWLDRTFAEADVDGSGALDTKEVQYTAYFVAKAFERGVFKSIVLANTVVRELDTSGDGRLDKDEVAGEVTPGTMGDVLRAGFEESDTDGDMLLDPREVAKSLDPVLADL